MDRLKEYLENNHETQESFARRIGTTARTVQYWLAGKGKPRNPTKLIEATSGYVTLADIYKESEK